MGILTALGAINGRVYQRLKASPLLAPLLSEVWDILKFLSEIVKYFLLVM
jgi:hypothetical protein